MDVMVSVIYAECCKLVIYADCHANCLFTECLYAECRYAEYCYAEYLYAECYYY